MKKWMLCGAVGLTACGHSVIIEFNPFIGPGPFTFGNSSYFESGFELFSTTGMEANFVGAWGIAVRPQGFADTITLKTQNGARMGIIHFPVVENFPSDTITATGYLATSGTVTSTFTGSGLWNLNWGLTYATGLTKIEFAYSPGSSSWIDHLEVISYPVPEPGALFVLGMGSWLLLRRRR